MNEGMVTYNGKQVPIYGGAWADEMNSCFYNVIGHIKGYDICQENGDNTVFALSNPMAEDEPMDTKDQVKERISKYANKYGFRVEDNNFTIEGFSIIDDSKTVNFTISPDLEEIDWEKHFSKTTIRISASIATMGGNPTSDELLEMAETIKRAGCFVSAMDIINGNHKGLTYTKTW